MAEIRAADWGTEDYWRERIFQYLTYKLHPQEALRPLVSIVYVEHERIVGLIAGHLTRRFGCEGELEWISVRQVPGSWHRVGITLSVSQMVRGPSRSSRLR